jgi:hypothetical protein
MPAVSDGRWPAPSACKLLVPGTQVCTACDPTLQTCCLRCCSKVAGWEYVVNPVTASAADSARGLTMMVWPCLRYCGWCSSSASGTVVVLPAPGGACSTRDSSVGRYTSGTYALLPARDVWARLYLDQQSLGMSGYNCTHPHCTGAAPPAASIGHDLAGCLLLCVSAKPCYATAAVMLAMSACRERTCSTRLLCWSSFCTMSWMTSLQARRVWFADGNTKQPGKHTCWLGGCAAGPELLPNSRKQHSCH